MLWYLISVFLILISIAHAGEIDNGVVGLPTLDCFDNGLRLSFRTEKPFSGRVFVKGMSENRRCSMDFRQERHRTHVSIDFDASACAMERQRKPGPNGGIVSTLSVLVMFHGTFITKVDKTYKCICFFRRQAMVTSYLDVSDIGVTDLMDRKEMARCTYTLRHGSPYGREIRYSRVGEPIYHTWDCDDDGLGILVHSCWGNDGTGRRTKFDFYDRNGCSVDPVIMPDIQYSSPPKRAWVESHGFKFSTSTTIRFSCVLETCRLSSGECSKITPPRCNQYRPSSHGVVRPPAPQPPYVRPPAPPPRPRSRYVRPPPREETVHSRYEAGEVVFGPDRYGKPPAPPPQPSPPQPPAPPPRPNGYGQPRRRPEEEVRSSGYDSGAVVFGPHIPYRPAPRGGIRIAPGGTGGGYKARSKRDTGYDDENAYDVLTSLTIFDRFDNEENIGYPAEGFNTGWGSNFSETEVVANSSGKTCMSSPAFSSLIAVMSITFVTCLITTTYLLLNGKKSGKQ